MKNIICLVLSSAAVLAAVSAQADAVTDCRAAHANDPELRIACLEAALHAAAEPTPHAGSLTDTTQAPTGLGSEQVQQTQRASGKIADNPAAVTIVSATYQDQGLGLFKMQDGQVWKETEKTPPQFWLEPGRTYRARIQRGTVGGYRMHVEGVRRMLKVKRLE